MPEVRTTLTFDSDVVMLLRKSMRERGISLNKAVNDAIRAGLAIGTGDPFEQRTFAMGHRPELNYDKALPLAAAIDDETLIQKLAMHE